MYLTLDIIRQINQTYCIYFLRNGIYPLTAFGTKQPPLVRSRAMSPERAESVKSVTPEPMDVETRKIINMMCDIKPKEDDSCELLVRQVILYVFLRFKK